MTRFLALYRFLLRRQLTLGRALAFGALTAVALTAAFAINRGVPSHDRLEAGVGFTTLFGLGLMMPITTLVLASSSLGDLIDDETLVYVWHRPLPRWLLAAAAWSAATTVAAPITVAALTTSVFIATGGHGAATWGTAAATLLGVIGYGGLFVLAGVVFRRALVWGLIYLFIWESFVARVGQGAARLSIGSYPTSVLADASGIELPMADRPAALAVLVPLAVAIAAIAWTGRRLNRIDVA